MLRKQKPSSSHANSEWPRKICHPSHTNSKHGSSADSVDYWQLLEVDVEKWRFITLDRAQSKETMN